MRNNSLATARRCKLPTVRAQLSYGICPCCNRLLTTDADGRIARRRVPVDGHMKLSDVLGWCDGTGRLAISPRERCCNEKFR